MLEGPDEHLLDGSNYHLAMCLVSSVVLIEDGGGNVMGVSQVGDLGAGHN